MQSISLANLEPLLFLLYHLNVKCTPDISQYLTKGRHISPIQRGMTVIREFEIWSKLYHCNVCNIVLYYFHREI